MSRGLGTGLIGTIAALVLSLLISSANGSFDTESGQVKRRAPISFCSLKEGGSHVPFLTITAATTAVALLAVFICYVPEADAVVCARGVYRAGCAGPNGAVVGHRAAVPGVHGLMEGAFVADTRAAVTILEQATYGKSDKSGSSSVARITTQ